MRKALAALNKRFERTAGLLPLVEDGFVAGEYAKEVGIAPSTARERLEKLALDGLVRRVRIRRPGGIQRGWQIVEVEK